MKNQLLTDELLIDLLIIQHTHDIQLDAIEEAGLSMEPLRISLLGVVTEALRIPTEEGRGDWFSELHFNSSADSREEWQEFLDEARAKIRATAI